MTGLEDIEHLIVRNNDRHQIGAFRQVGDGRVGFRALDLVVVGVHRINADAVSRFECGGEEPPAVLQSRRRPDYGDGARVEHLVDRLHLRRCPDLHASPPELTALISASPLAVDVPGSQVLQLRDNETGMRSCLATKPSVAGWHRRQEEASPWSREYRHPNGQARSSVSC